MPTPTTAQYTPLTVEDYTHAPASRFILTTGVFGQNETEDTYHEVCSVPVGARQPADDAARWAALFAAAPEMVNELRRCLPWLIKLAADRDDDDIISTAVLRRHWIIGGLLARIEGE